MFKIFFPLKIYSRDFSFEDLFRRFFIFMKMCSWRFVLWRLVQEIFPFKNLFRRFFPLWKKKCFRRFILLKFYSGDFSFYEDVFMKICPLMINSRDFSIWRFVQEIFPFMKIYSGDFSFEDLFRRFFLLKIY